MKYIDYLNKVSQEIRRKPLNTIERDIIDLLFQGKTYLEIADQSKYDDGYIGDIARELYGLIGQKHKVKVTRSNLFGVLDSVIGGEYEPDFFTCHGIKQNTLFNSSVIEFSRDNLMFNLSLFWKFNAVTRSLILKTKHPVVLNIDDLSPDSLGITLIRLSRQKQVSGDAMIELLKILDNYFD